LSFLKIMAATAALLATLAHAQTNPATGGQLRPSAAPASAASGADQPLSKGEIKAMREFKLLDFNGDGKLSRAEVKLFPRLSAAFDEADTNHDNYISYEEVRAFAIKYRAERERLRAEQAANATHATPSPAASAAEPKAD
jgi:Ca2+-binding EF-hand superfamily protein